MTKPSQLREAWVEGIRLAYAEAGAGPPLVMIHGLLVNHREWDSVAAHLDVHFRCLRPDLPGCGASAKPSPERFSYRVEAHAEVLAAFIESTSEGPVELCGHSMGGAVALVLAADYPHLVKRLSILDYSCFPFPLPLKGQLALVPRVGNVIFRYLYRRPVFNRYFKDDVYAPGHPLDRQRLNEYYRDFDSPGGRDAAYASMVHLLKSEHLIAKLEKVHVPTLVLWGDKDPLFPVQLASQMVENLPDAQLEVLKESGHAPNEEQPARVAALLRSHHQAS